MPVVIRRNEIKNRKSLTQRNQSLKRKKNTLINFIEESTNRTNGTLFSNDLSEEILDVFNFFISASNIRKYRYNFKILIL